MLPFRSPRYGRLEASCDGDVDEWKQVARMGNSRPGLEQEQEQDATRMMQKFWRWNGLDCRKLDAE